jgi:hypothetical protein
MPAPMHALGMLSLAMFSLAILSLSIMHVLKIIPSPLKTRLGNKGLMNLLLKCLHYWTTITKTKMEGRTM